MQLVAGYQNNYGLIFTGKIRFSITGMDSPSVTFAIIQSIDSHDVCDYAIKNATLGAEHTPAEQHHALLERLAHTVP